MIVKILMVFLFDKTDFIQFRRPLDQFFKIPVSADFSRDAKNM